MLMSICRSHSSTLRRLIGAIGIMPALFTRTSTRPKLLTAPLMSASTSTRCVTSTANPTALPPAAEISFTTASIRFFRRAPRTTFAPCCARSFAVLSPSPLLAPVMTTTLFAIPDVPMVLFSLLRIRMFPPVACAPLNDGPGDLGNFLHQRVAERGYVDARRKIGALPGPQRQKIGLARRLRRDRE